MNVKNNKRRLKTQEKIEKAFINMVLTKNINQISVTDICKETNINRTTFYANYIDVYDLADKIRVKIEHDFNKAFDDAENHTALSVFAIIYENQILFKLYFKLGYDKEHRAEIYNEERAERDFGGKHIKYHIEFFKSGLNAVIKMWLDGGCTETPEEMAEIIKTEYGGRTSDR